MRQSYVRPNRYKLDRITGTHIFFFILYLVGIVSATIFTFFLVELFLRLLAIVFLGQSLPPGDIAFVPPQFFLLMIFLVFGRTRGVQEIIKNIMKEKE